MNNSFNKNDKRILKKISLKIKKRFFNDKYNNLNTISIKPFVNPSSNGTQIKAKAYDDKFNITNYYGPTYG